MELKEYNEALERIKERIQPLGTERVSLENAVTRILGEAVQAAGDYPPGRTSAMDGFALQVGGAQGGPPYRFHVVGTIFAGDEPTLSPGLGEAIRIMTGALVPDSADTVIPLENVRVDGDFIELMESPLRGKNIRSAGEDYRESEVLLHTGQYLTPPAVALIASAGHSEVEVFERPRVIVLSTGNELVSPGRPIRTGQIWESNSYYIYARLSSLGIKCTRDAVGDDIDDVKRAIDTNLKNADAVITTGGVSVGDRDYIAETWHSLGGETLVHGLRIKPGKPCFVGFRNGKWLFGLPGNPASAFIGFELLVYPWIWWMQGMDLQFPLRVIVRLRHKLQNSSNRWWYVRSILEYMEGELYAVPLALQGSHILTSSARALALLEIPPGVRLDDEQTAVAIPLYWHPFDLLTPFSVSRSIIES